MATILVLSGPNLNLLGTREPGHYGNETLCSIILRLQNEAEQAGHKLESLQSNAEADLINRVHQAREENIDYILLNPAALTHTSIALRDALLGVEIPFIELHLSNTYARESFRHHSYFSDIAQGVITGLGPHSYSLALQAAIRALKPESTNK
ncbi:MAG: type II 3-dehydroquinate dehydratase [Gammaproteobacteria bacterium]|jgi:3-dehydroquinate dehydratase II|nr:type II 3-dehydroquinate dehydratase [Gammaproteobacteria bacterium]MBT7306820.1 type II 3-dehydroquinate dehydratase [Gammaproteobacteria bacterium]